MTGIVTMTDDNRMLVIVEGDWRLPQRIMNCLRDAGPGLAQTTTIHITTPDGKDQLGISLEVNDGEIAIQFKKTIQIIRALKEANIIQTAELA